MKSFFPLYTEIILHKEKLENIIIIVVKSSELKCDIINNKISVWGRETNTVISCWVYSSSFLFMVEWHCTLLLYHNL